ncbi:MAG: putative phosphatidylinositol alpha-mannosyltransferase [Anaerolineaceae bacterium]|nr:MAG: putative phosphatidylinositol alpha-mannosyltransferase [Anaerolineaceae bacterium]
MAETPVRITHVIAGLGVGGAEMSLLKLLSTLDRGQFPAEVISLTGDAPLGERIRLLGIPVRALDLAPGRPDPRLVLRLAAHLRRSRPDLVQTWMYHADLIGGLAARLAGLFHPPPVVWNVRHTFTNMDAFKPGTRLVVRLDARLSRTLPARIVCNAEAGRRSHAAIGYAADKMVVIPNGFDIDAFRPDPQARRDVRRELGIGEETPLVGLCARFHPDKDHHTFFRAAALLHARMPEARFLLWGKGVDEGNPAISAWLDEAGLRGVAHLLGPRDDSPRLTAALDVAALSSASEAFPTVVGEAMACEIPCAVTDVGDAADIVGETGRVVPPGDPPALAEAWQSLLALPAAERAALGQQARRRVLARFDIKQTAAAYARLYRDIIAGRLE